MKATLLTPVLGFALSSLTASAGLIATTSYNGSTYELWEQSGITWAAANTAASAAGGHLATFTDAAETQAVYDAFIGTGFFTANSGQRYQAWLGGYTTETDQSTTDSWAWAWVTGEAWDAYAAGNFAAFEPNGDSTGLTINRFGTPYWNDEGGLVGGYIVEKSVSVPDGGSALALMTGGVALLGLYSRRTRG